MTKWSPSDDDGGAFGASAPGSEDQGGLRSDMTERTTKEGPHLRGVPEPTTADRRAPVARWVVTLCEPLVSTERRLQADTEMAQFVGSNSQWAAHWFAGFIVETLMTLPPDDPWRHLSATIDFGVISLGQSGLDDNKVEFRNPRGAPSPTSTGSVLPSGQRFGTPEDSADIVSSAMGRADADIGLAALVDPLDDISSAIAGFATASVEAFDVILTKTYHHLWLSSDFGGQTEDPSGQRFLAAVAPVLRRFIHRRRVYTGLDDPYPSLAGFAWMARADRLMDGNRNISSELGLARSAAIDPGAYAELRF